MIYTTTDHWPEKGQADGTRVRGSRAIISRCKVLVNCDQTPSFDVLLAQFISLAAALWTQRNKENDDFWKQSLINRSKNVKFNGVSIFSVS